MSKPSAPSKWKRVKLADYARIVSGATPKSSEPRYWDGNIPWVTPKDVSDLAGYPFLDKTPRTLTAEGLASCSAEVLPPKSVLLSSRAPIGLVAINRIPVATNQGFKSFVPDTTRLDGGFLYHWLRANRSFLESLGTGATFKEVSKAVVSRIEISLPPLDEQKRIAAVLDRADALRRKRRESLKLIDKLLQSVFIAMFGNLSQNALRIVTFEEIALPGRGMFSNGPFGSDLLTSELQDAGVPVVYIRDIRNGEFAWKSNVFVTPEKAATLPSCEVRPNDVLIAKVGDPPGVAALYPTNLAPAIITQDVIRVRINMQIAIPIFIQHYLNSEDGRHLIQTITVKGTRSRFSLRDLKRLRMPIPSLEIQAAFSNVATRILELRHTSRENREDLDSVFSSLQQRSFRGELDLSRLSVSDEIQPPAPNGAPKPTTRVGRYMKPGSFIAPPEVEAQMMALEDKLDYGTGDSIPWSEDFFKYRTLSQVLDPPFSFIEVWEQVRYDMEDAEYEDVKTKLFEYVEEGILEQQFDQERKEIVFYPRT